MQMIKTAIEETRLRWWRTMFFTCMHLYDMTGSKTFLYKGARYASRIEGLLNLRQMDEEEGLD